MTFEEILDQAVALLQRRGRVTYRTLKRQFALDDDALDDLKEEIIDAQRVAVEEDGRILVWTGDSESASSPPVTAQKLPPTEPERELLSYTPQHLAEKILTSRSALEGERKQVTVLFADTKGSTELIRDLDPEDAQKLLDPAIHLMMEAVHRFEGTVNQVLGDGVMALFGAPIAHEDHAARACYAALAMQSAMRDYTDEVRRTHSIPLQIRVGLNSGEVVVRTISSDLYMDYSAVGSTTHLAARMEQLATPGSIVLSGATLRLVEGLVRVDALGPILVKGVSEPVEVYELTGASSIRRRLQAAVARGLTKFVGRDTEIASLNQALEQAGAGHGQIVAAVGEAGVGKSRLVYEFVRSHRTQGWLVLESASVSYGKATPYFPVVDLLKHYIHVEDGDDARTIRAKVTGQILTLDESLQETIPPLLSLLDALPEESPFLQLDPPQRRQRTLDGLKRILLRESQVQLLLLVFEDLHWIDFETQRLLDSLVESLPTARLLLLINYRPEYQHGWGSKTYYTQLRLDPLPPARADALLQALVGDDPGLDPLKQRLIERTAGNPFFLEESVRTLVETQVLSGAPGAYRLVQALPTIEVPATVQAILAARIDRLAPDEKRLLQTSAVIGHEVPLSLLQAVAEMPEAALYRGLTHLQAAEFLYETSLFPECIYTFKHALTHEVTYGSLLQERRRLLHGQILDALETKLKDHWLDQVESLAHHALRGERWDKALAYFRQAGRKAELRMAYREAVVCFEQALVALGHLPQTQDSMAQAIDLRFDLRNVLWPLRRLDQVGTYIRQAEVLAEALGDQRRLGWIAGYLSTQYTQGGDWQQAIAVGERALTLAAAGKDVALELMANFRLALACNVIGDYRRAQAVLRRNIITLEGDLCYQRFDLTGFPAVVSRCQLVWCLTEVGAFSEAQQYEDEALQIAETVDHTFSLLTVYPSAGLHALRQGNFSDAITVLEHGLSRSHTVDVPFFVPQIVALLGAAYAQSGRTAEAVPLLEQAIEQTTAMQVIFAQTSALVWLGEAHLLASRPNEALAVANQALAYCQSRQEHGTQAWALRLLGDIATHRNASEIEQAEPHYQQALTLAEELGMRPLQAHCHRGLGTLYRQTGQREQARAELSTAIAMYRDMEMTFWLPETEATLAAVEGQ